MNILRITTLYTQNDYYGKFYGVYFTIIKNKQQLKWLLLCYVHRHVLYRNMYRKRGENVSIVVIPAGAMQRGQPPGSR